MRWCGGGGCCRGRGGMRDGMRMMLYVGKAEKIVVCRCDVSLQEYTRYQYYDAVGYLDCCLFRLMRLYVTVKGRGTLSMSLREEGVSVERGRECNSLLLSHKF